ncbi:MAG: tRNA (N(6)-L-threonylcarbamoyladenosine(37)-C(2))-methylthiotransferase [Candidatus Bilamarchaeaceae archaeon]
MTSTKKVYVEVYGCTLNQADADIMRAIIKKEHRIVENEKEADVVVFVTCTVKGATENKIMEKMKRTKKPKVIAGCLYVNKDRIKREIKNPVVIGPYAIERINEGIDAALKKKELWLVQKEEKIGVEREYTAPILRVPIQEGCIGNCFFCQTKLARPYIKSYLPKTIRWWIEKGIERGAKEIQLTGMDSGVYGIDIGTNLISLIKELVKIEGDFKIRLGMINPQHLNRFGKELIDVMKSKKFYKFIHIPVQTGSEKVCKEMNRPHTVKDFIKWTKAFRKAIRGITIATDIIVGYPTETEDDFKKTLALIKKIKPDIVNLSKFTPRPKTKAAAMKQLPTEIIKRRSEETARLIKKIAAEKNKKYIGKEIDVLTLEKGANKSTKGRSNNYKQIVIKGLWPLGSYIKVKIKNANHGSLFGEVVR